MCLELPIADPVVDDGKFQQNGWEALKENILKQSHQRKFVSHFDTHVVTDNRVDELRLLHDFPPRSLSRSRL